MKKVGIVLSVLILSVLFVGIVHAMDRLYTVCVHDDPQLKKDAVALARIECDIDASTNNYNNGVLIPCHPKPEVIRLDVNYPSELWCCEPPDMCLCAGEEMFCVGVGKFTE